MKKADLRDGMVVGVKCGSVTTFKMVMSNRLIDKCGSISLDYFDEDLIRIKDKDRDIEVKICAVYSTKASRIEDVLNKEYFDLIWKRNEYYTLEEVSKKRGRYKHKDANIWQSCPQNALTNAIGITKRDMWDLLKAMEFELE